MLDIIALTGHIEAWKLDILLGLALRDHKLITIEFENKSVLEIFKSVQNDVVYVPIDAAV